MLRYFFNFGLRDLFRNLDGEASESILVGVGNFKTLSLGQLTRHLIGTCLLLSAALYPTPSRRQPQNKRSYTATELLAGSAVRCYGDPNRGPKSRPPAISSA